MRTKEAKQRAMRKQAEKRKNMKRVGFYCTGDEKELCRRMALHHGSEYAAIMKGLKLLEQQTKENISK